MNNENQTEQASVSVGRDVKDGVAVAGHDNITNVTMNITQSPEKPDTPKPDDTRFLFPNYIIVLALIGLSVWWWFAIQNKLKPFEEKTYGIIVTQFKGNTDAQKNKGKEIQASIQSTLNARFKELGINDANARNASILMESHEAAREYGKKYKAELVIWGDVTLQGVIPNITVVNQKDTISKVFKSETTILKDSLCHAAMAQIKDIRFPALTDEPTKLVSFVTAVKYYEQGKYEKALEYIMLSIPEKPTKYIDNHFIFFYKGNIYYGMEEYDKAIDAYTQTIEINYKHYNAYIGRGFAYADKGEYDKAIDDFTKAVHINPKNDNFVFWNSFAAAYAEAGKFEDAVKTQEKAIEMLNEKDKSKYLSEYTEHLNFYKAKKSWREKKEQK